MNFVAYCGFLLLFPVFVLYHYAVATGWVPAFLGGMFGISAVLVSLFGLLYMATSMTVAHGTPPLLERAFLFFVVYLALWTVAASLLAASRAYTGPAVAEALATLLIWMAAFFIGARLPLRALRSWPSLLLLVALIGLCFGHAVYSHGSFVGPFLVFQGEAEAQDVHSTYQGVGRAILVIAVVISSLPHRIWAQLCVLGLAAVALLALGSREHLFAILLLILLQVLLFGFRRRNIWTGVVAVVILSGAVYAASDLFLNTRAAEIFSLGQSTSWQARIAANEEAIQVIEEDPFFGAFGYHWADQSAGYAHNLLSAWAGFGGVAFAIYLGMMLYALAVSAGRVVSLRNCPAIWKVALQFNVVALLLGLAAEPIYASVFPALGWGFAVSALRSESGRRRLGATAARAYAAAAMTWSHGRIR